MSIAKSELAILKRDADLLQEAETEMAQSIGLAERGYAEAHNNRRTLRVQCYVSRCY